MVVGVGGQDGAHLPHTQADADIDHPQQTMGKRRLAQGQACESAGRVETDDRESYHPSDDGLRARGVLDAKSPGESTQDARDGAKANARHEKELPGQQDHVHLGLGDASLRWARELTQTRLGRFEGCGGAVAFGCEASDLFPLVAIVVAALRRFVFPLMSTVLDCGELTHHVRSSPPLATGDRGCLGLRGRGSPRRERSEA